MTSSNGNIFRVTGHLCGEFTGPRWISHTRASDAEVWCFLWINGWVNNREAGDLKGYRAHYDVVMIIHANIVEVSRFSPIKLSSTERPVYVICVAQPTQCPLWVTGGCLFYICGAIVTWCTNILCWWPYALMTVNNVTSPGTKSIVGCQRNAEESMWNVIVRVGWADGLTPLVVRTSAGITMTKFWSNICHVCINSLDPSDII